jgi:thiol:disulfide interchange protein DsbD
MILKKLTNFSNKSLAIIPSLILGFGIFCGYEQMTQKPMESHVSLDWLNDETEAMNLAKLENRPILIDMWAEWCSACKKMDAYTFSDIALREKIKHKNWILLKLDLTESNDKNDEIEERYNLQGLPALIILPPPSLKLPQVSLHGYIGVDTLIKYIDKF